MTVQQFYVGGSYLGQRDIPRVRLVPRLEQSVQRSIAYFCPKCGDVWGRIVHLASDYTQCVQRACAKHGDGRLGTLPYNILGEPTNVEHDWPAQAVRYEFAAELAYAEKREREIGALV